MILRTIVKNTASVPIKPTLPKTVIASSKKWLFPFFALSLSLLSGCAQQPTITHKADWTLHQAQLQQLTNYHAQGVFGYISPQQRVTLTFNWQNQADDYQLILTKMYKTVLKLDAHPNAVTLIAPDGKTYHGTDAAQLVQQLTGISLPLQQMQDWLIGLPTGADNYLLNKNDQVAFLTKKIAGRTWEMHYSTYDNTQVPSLPTLMTLKQGNLTIKIKVSQWKTK
ncbi:lipoprotein insertase outer membrane protein LolB [Photobacterium toruni]|uniref:Outer-membrane lipoprotein LolB n=1 Tax=Photobacterium toruni TaxID=1935446 RepID=A0A1T4UG69_9GAMM|nr:lipoprotein insertase outer membrane protein LolB [Photobacterium toruni]MEC6815364.1 lipoprotein insertase outer membrane protein LolB [Photobacterium toruni]MEC6831782.1 lipoprotein insertase outer membrane protein LolB [Photobacterium toruni]SKA51518.1 Outer-membrane lipoprotein LolB precursor [Photobacterium toruni]